jgi:riboflavin synthase
MFTGIVEEVGRIRRRSNAGLEIQAQLVLEDTKAGDSTCINGVCLTVVERGGEWFTVDTVPETLRRTNLGDLSIGDPVNLERALGVTSRIGGHFVQGHVEGTAAIESIEPDGDAILVRFKADEELMRYIVEKGFVAIDGASLTIVDRAADSFRVTLIPFTREHTNLGSRGVGDRVNIETDILAKYVERFLNPTG